MKRLDQCLVASWLVLCVSCAHVRSNSRLQTWSPDSSAGYRLENLQTGRGSRNTESLFVVLTFSGGGTRSAALSYGALEQLRRTMIYWKGETKSLLSEVDVIAAVSGGSFTALYYGLHGDEMFEDFEDRFLYNRIQSKLIQRVVLSPWSWIRLASPHFDRIDLAAELYDRDVFDGKTYRDLLDRRTGPYIIVNATDMTSGARFEFTQDQFDYLCSDLADFPLSRAAAASSAFPGLLSPLTVVNHHGCGVERPEWYQNAVEERELNPVEYANARLIDRYLDPDSDYVHLVDGGVSDNIGLRGPLYAVISNSSPWSLVDKMNQEEIEKLLVISVNAKTASAKSWDQKQNAPSFFKVLKTAGNTPMAHYSFETVDRMKVERESQNQLQDTLRTCSDLFRENCPDADQPEFDLHKVDYYSVEVTFEALDDPDQETFFRELPTTFQLDPDVVDCLRGAAGTILADSDNFGKFLHDLDELARQDRKAQPEHPPGPGFPWPCQ